MNVKENIKIFSKTFQDKKEARHKDGLFRLQLIPSNSMGM